MHAERPRLVVPLLALIALVLAFGAITVRAQETAAAPAPATPPSTFSFRAENISVKQALALFARANALNVVPDLDIEGQVTVEFQDLPLDLAMRAILDANGYYFVQDGNLIRVHNRETRLFQVDYINTTRTGQGSNAVQISSGGASSGGAGGGGAGGGSNGGSEGSTMTVTANSTINFWGDLATQIKGMISANGAVTVNSLAGTIIVSDTHRNLDTVAQFLSSVTESVVRQIDLEVQIYEVAFSNSRQLGIDWSRLASQYQTTFETGLIVRAPVYGPTPGGPAAFINQKLSPGITAVIEALSQQGELKVISKPRLRTLNNQPAVVRVGQDLPVFTRQVTQSPGTPPVITTTEMITTITVGTVLSITPQVSAGGLITLDISPAVSRLVRTATSASGDTSAPVIDIRQASSIVRLRDGDTVVMGGLVQDGTATTHRRVPLLGDIPLLGRAFQGESLSTERTELVFFLTPRIVHDTDGPK